MAKFASSSEIGYNRVFAVLSYCITEIKQNAGAQASKLQV
jgi:hypothetical protein